MGWHPQALAATGLPKDKYGLVDWAKLVRENIIKPKPSLDPEEEEIIRRHPTIGYDLLKGVPGISPEILDGVRHHHEYLDGSGYPDGLAGSQISDLVRLLTISGISSTKSGSDSYSLEAT